MKKLGESNQSVIVELSRSEYESLMRLGGYDYGQPFDQTVNLEKVLSKLSQTRLAFIVTMLREIADNVESIDQKETV